MSIPVLIRRSKYCGSVYAILPTIPYGGDPTGKTCLWVHWEIPVLTTPNTKYKILHKQGRHQTQQKIMSDTYKVGKEEAQEYLNYLQVQFAVFFTEPMVLAERSPQGAWKQRIARLCTQKLLANG